MSISGYFYPFLGITTQRKGKLTMAKYLKNDNLREKQKRGQGDAENYTAYIRPTEFNSLGTAVTLRDWITGRTVHLLSQGESYMWHLLRFNDDIVEIKEQYPLNRDDTIRIANALDLRHPQAHKNYHMTTDFYITYKDGSEKAISFKSNRRSLETTRTKELMAIEQAYWLEKGVDFSIVFKTDIPFQKAENIRVCAIFWDEKDVTEPIACMKHCLIHKFLVLPETEFEEELDFPKLVLKYKKEIDKTLYLINKKNAEEEDLWKIVS